MGFVTKVWNSPDNNPKGIQPTVVLRYKSEKKKYSWYFTIIQESSLKKPHSAYCLQKHLIFFCFSDSSNGAEPLHWVVVKYVPKTIFI
jgi:hypothetical protein